MNSILLIRLFNHNSFDYIKVFNKKFFFILIVDVFRNNVISLNDSDQLYIKLIIELKNYKE